MVHSSSSCSRRNCGIQRSFFVKNFFDFIIDIIFSNNRYWSTDMESKGSRSASAFDSVRNCFQVKSRRNGTRWFFIWCLAYVLSAIRQRGTRYYCLLRVIIVFFFFVLMTKSPNYLTDHIRVVFRAVRICFGFTRISTARRAFRYNFFFFFRGQIKYIYVIINIVDTVFFFCRLTLCFSYKYIVEKNPGVFCGRGYV